MDADGGRQRGFTGYRRRRQTPRSVWLADALAGKLIAAGGIGTIVAVSTVFAFLAYVVVPLFQSPRASDPVARTVDRTGPGQVVQLVADEYRVLGWALTDDGGISVLRLDTGEVIGGRRLAESVELTAWSLSIDSSDVILGFADGTVRLGRVELTARPIADDAAPPGADQLEIGGVAVLDGRVLTRTPTGLRVHGLEVELDDAAQVGEGRPIVLIDRANRPDGTILAAMTDRGRVYVRSVRRQENLMTGEVTLRLWGGDFQADQPPGAARPVRMLMSGPGDSVYIAWDDGQLARYDTRDLEAPVLAELVDLVPDPGAELTTLSLLLGRSTLLAGDSTGTVRAFFRVRDRQAEANVDNWRLVAAHHLEGPSAAVTSIGSSQRTRTAAVGYANGTIRLFQVTSASKLAELSAEPDRPVQVLAMAPKEDAVLALCGDALWSWDIDLKHHEASFATLFRPVWYEGESQPVHVWQSSSGDDAFEPKLGLAPLVFGTLKATVYAMLFGGPLALLAAIYTSEFLHPKFRSKVKPAIEMMASLPSVVLGFVAALVVAPFVEGIVPQVLTAMFAIPLALLLGARLWQLLPGPIARRLGPWRIAGVLGFLVLGAAAAALLGGAVERGLFAGDIKQWLAGRRGSGVSGWLLLTIPLSAVGVAIASSRWVNPALRRRAGGMGRGAAGLVDLGRFLLGVLATVLGALLLAWLLNNYAWDPRGGASFLGTYVQRNALVVGFIMGFAIIPIIYTIAEDALSTVPDHLRSASLGAGATPWQTAVRIVVPTAMSGLFSAGMIGLGRAVGETMIVLMAAGNTPVMEWNLFNGLRTLSANIAVELPEAPQGGTHYRTLFLAALALFVMTFLVNTVAEVVRLRFRRRAYQL